MINHVWFDVSGTLAIETPPYVKAHNNLRYSTYAKLINKVIDNDLIEEYESLYKKHGSNSAVFRSLGMASDYWQQYFNTLNKSDYYTPDERVYGTLEKLRTIVPISIFTNVTLDENEKTLELLGIEQSWFTFIITGDDIAERKPALDGFNLMLVKSGLPPNQLLYVGDRVDVDIKPANQLGIITALVWDESNEANYSFTDFRDIMKLFVGR